MKIHSLNNKHILEFWSDFACFTRPELKAERFSYPCPTPSAARGLLEAIYFKPQFRWQIEKIEILNMPTYIALRRNEVKDVASISNVKKWIKGTSPAQPLVADDGSQRQQRQTIAVKNPKYRITAEILPRPGHEKSIKGFNEQIIRRATNGKNYFQPSMGCREFVAFYKYIDSEDEMESPVDFSQNLGLMLYDVFELNQINNKFAEPYISMFRAVIQKGVLEVPPYDCELVLKPERRVV